MDSRKVIFCLVAQPRLGIWNLGILESGNLLQIRNIFGSGRLLCLESWNLGILESWNLLQLRQQNEHRLPNARSGQPSLGVALRASTVGGGR